MPIILVIAGIDGEELFQIHTVTHTGGLRLYRHRGTRPTFKNSNPTNIVAQQTSTNVNPTNKITHYMTACCMLHVSRVQFQMMKYKSKTSSLLECHLLYFQVKLQIFFFKIHLLFHT